MVSLESGDELMDFLKKRSGSLKEKSENYRDD